MYERHLADRLRRSMGDTPIALIVGARQVGKSTLVQQVIADDPRATYLTLDDLTALSAARSDPEGFIAGLEGTVAIDEIQRAPDLLLAIKAAVDRDRRPGRFVLTGSTNVLGLPRVSETLAGRVEVLELRPLSQAEIAGLPPTFIDRCFASEPTFLDGAIDRGDLAARITAGGFPEAVARSGRRRVDWFDAYVTTMISRDIRDLSRIEDVTALPRLLSVLAARTAGLLNVSDVSRTLGMPGTTVQRYLAILETIMLVDPLPAWSANLGRRLVRAPKTALVDPGLAAALQGADAGRLRSDPDALGPLLESFVVEEVRRLASAVSAAPRAYHYRDGSGQEVDLVLERRDGSLVGIEVKAGATVDAAATRGLRSLAAAVGDRFIRGIVLYSGPRVVPLGDRLVAVPLPNLWSADRSRARNGSGDRRSRDGSR